MIYEVTIERLGTNAQGVTKKVKEQFLVNETLFSSAEFKVLEYQGQYSEGCEVVAMKRSRAVEMINKREDEDAYIYEATIIRSTLDENTGVEKNTEYCVFLHAVSVQDATEKMTSYIGTSMFDEELKSVKKTKFIELI